jgi:hypothetical protein
VEQGLEVSFAADLAASAFLFRCGVSAMVAIQQF